MLPEASSQIADERKQPCLRPLAVHLRHEDAGSDSRGGGGGERKRARQVIGGLVEEKARLGLGDERTDRREHGIRNPHRLQAGVAEVTRERGENEGLSRPGERQRGVGQEIGRPHRRQRERGHADGEREVWHAPPVQGREDEGPDAGGNEERRAAVGSLLEQLPRQDERDAERRERVPERDRVDVGLLHDDLSAHPDSEQGEDEGRGDENSPRSHRRDRIHRQPLDLRTDDHRSREQELMPSARDGHSARRDENDHGERGGLPRHLGVECLESRCEGGTEKPDGGDDL